MSRQEYSTDQDVVAVHWCWPIGDTTWSDGSKTVRRVTVVRSTINQHGATIINTAWYAGYSYPEDEWTGICTTRKAS